ncbi:MAG TPA: hypothetical protein PK950_02060 [Candidatus Paceibacterota bacterium]|nr:hypothetical protein [Candidatus Paceibacterota bacterium]
MKKLIALLTFTALATACSRPIQQATEPPRTEKKSETNARAKPIILEHVIIDLCGNNMPIGQLRDSVHYYLDLYSRRDPSAMTPEEIMAAGDTNYVDCGFKLDSSAINAEHKFRFMRWYTPTYIPILGVNLNTIVFLDIECRGMYSTFMLMPNSSVCRFSGNSLEAKQFLESSLERIRRVPLDNDERNQVFRGQCIGYLNFAINGIYCKDRRIGEPAETNPQAKLQKE